MARLTDEQKEDLLADYHTGIYSKNELAKRYNTSHTTVNKMTKGLEPKHKDKVSTLSTIKAELAEESFKEVSAVETAVDEQTKHLIIINNNATKLANKLNNMTDEIDTADDLKKLVDANDKLAITLKVADRHAPKTVVNTGEVQETNNNLEVVFK